MHRWVESLKTGRLAPIFKKGDREVEGNYRGVVMLAMRSRILSRVLAAHLRWWAKHLQLLDDKQKGIRQRRSTVDATQLQVKMQKDMVDLKKGRAAKQLIGLIDKRKDLEARLLDFKKAYPSVNKPALWGILQRYGLEGKFHETIQDLTETTAYHIRD